LNIWTTGMCHHVQLFDCWFTNITRVIACSNRNY
jgi:hypothetical protein